MTSLARDSQECRSDTYTSRPSNQKSQHQQHISVTICSPPRSLTLTILGRNCGLSGLSPITTIKSHGLEYASTPKMPLILSSVQVLLTLMAFLVSLFLLAHMEFNFSLAKNTEEPSDPSPQDAWHSPVQSPIDDLNAVLNDSGVFGFVFEESGSSPSPEKKAMPYEGWNWCKMPHVNTKTYTKPPEQYELQYVEVVCCNPFKRSIRGVTRKSTDSSPSQTHTVRRQSFPSYLSTVDLWIYHDLFLFLG